MTCPFKRYVRSGTTEARPYIPGEDMTAIYVARDQEPCEGGMILRNPLVEMDMWYVSPAYFAAHYKEMAEG